MVDIVDIIHASKIDASTGHMDSTYISHGLQHAQIFDDVLAEAKILSQKELKEKISKGDYKNALFHILKGLLNGRDYSRAAEIVENNYREKYQGQNHNNTIGTSSNNNYSKKEEVKTNTINEIINI